jgi:uracil-DNA glycosylase family 4
MAGRDFAHLERRIVSCKRCPRLVRWRRHIAREKTRRFDDWQYWGKPVPGFGDPTARVLVVGLAPAAHGANRTGRMFTGDRSGEWLYRTLHKSGFASQPESHHRADGLRLTDCYITAACRCAPPANEPLSEELASCRGFLLDELRLLKQVRLVVGLGKIGHQTAFRALAHLGRARESPAPKFAHGSHAQLNEDLTLMASFHPSQQNTFTGRLTEPMFESVFQRVHRLLDV